MFLHLEWGGYFPLTVISHHLQEQNTDKFSKSDVKTIKPVSLIAWIFFDEWDIRVVIGLNVLYLHLYSLADDILCFLVLDCTPSICLSKFPLLFLFSDAFHRLLCHSLNLCLMKWLMSNFVCLLSCLLSLFWSHLLRYIRYTLCVPAWMCECLCACTRVWLRPRRLKKTRLQSFVIQDVWEFTLREVSWKTVTSNSLHSHLLSTLPHTHTHARSHMCRDHERHAFPHTHAHRHACGDSNKGLIEVLIF